MHPSRNSVRAMANSLHQQRRRPRRLQAICCVNLILGTALLTGLVGCAIGQAGYLDDYGAVGGKWERVNPAAGRVGSPFSDAGTMVPGQAIDQPREQADRPADGEEPPPPQEESNARDAMQLQRIDAGAIELSLFDD